MRGPVRAAAVGLAVGLALFLAPGCMRLTARAARLRAEPPPPRSTPLVSLGSLSQDAMRLPARQRQVVAAALEMVGDPGSGFDCSGLVQRVYAAAGLRVPRTVRELWTRGSRVTGRDLRPGDLVFFAFERRPVDHVGIYAGRDVFVHVSNATRSVQLASLTTAPFAAACAGGRRLLETPSP
jgi:hypothetical protein